MTPSSDEREQRDALIRKGREAGEPNRRHRRRGYGSCPQPVSPCPGRSQAQTGLRRLEGPPGTDLVCSFTCTQSVRLPVRSRLGAYVALTKPRIIELLLVTTVPTMIVAARGLPSIWLMVATVAGGALAAGGANAINMYVDRDIDRLMKRTSKRPLVTGVDPAPRRADLRHRARGRRVRVPVDDREPAVGGAGRQRHPLLRLRLHAVAEAHVDAQHRDRRRGRRRPRARGLDRRHGHARLGADRAVRGHLLLDPAPLLGPRHPSTATTTPPPTCRCCRSVASARTTATRILGTRCCCGP